MSSLELTKKKTINNASNAVSHWWFQRLSAIVLVPLIAWSLSFVTKISKMTITGVFHTLHEPVNTILILITLYLILYHGYLGMIVIIEDYVHRIILYRIIRSALQIITIGTVIALTATLAYTYTLIL